MEYLKYFEDLHQLNSPAIDGIDSSKPKRDGKPSLYNQNVYNNPFYSTKGVDGGVGGGGVPKAGGNISPNVAIGTGYRGNVNIPGGMGSTPSTKDPMEGEEGVVVPLHTYTKKGITGDIFIKTDILNFDDFIKL